MHMYEPTCWLVLIHLDKVTALMCLDHRLAILDYGRAITSLVVCTVMFSCSGPQSSMVLAVRYKLPDGYSRVMFADIIDSEYW